MIVAQDRPFLCEMCERPCHPYINKMRQLDTDTSISVCDVCYKNIKRFFLPDIQMLDN